MMDIKVTMNTTMAITITMPIHEAQELRDFMIHHTSSKMSPLRAGFPEVGLEAARMLAATLKMRVV
jgi:hypothetical protein